VKGTSPASSHAMARIISWAVTLLLFLIVALVWGLAAESLSHTSDRPGRLQTPLILLSVIVGGLALFSGILIWRIQAVASSYSRAVALSRESRERYRFLAEGPPTIGIIRFTIHGTRFTDVNRAAITMFGSPRSALVSHPIEPFILPEDRDAFFQNIANLAHGVRHAEFTVQMLLAGGKRQHVTWHVSCPHQSGHNPGAIAVLIDATERKKAESERLERERLAGVLEMAGAAAHELNQPLQVALGNAELLASRMSSEDPSFRYVAKLRDEIERMTEIGQKIANISRYEVKKYPGDIHIVDIDKASSGISPTR